MRSCGLHSWPGLCRLDNRFEFGQICLSIRSKGSGWIGSFELIEFHFLSHACGERCITVAH
jgi:hypothetical protein